MQKTVLPLLGICYHIGEQQDHRHLGKLRGLEGQRANGQPALGAVIFVSEQKHSQRQPHGHHIEKRCHPCNDMVVHTGYQIHAHHPQGGCEKLLFKIIGRVMKLHPAIICTRAI